MAQAQAATAQLNATSAQAMAATAQLKAKGLEAPKRPARLNYSAPSVDGEGGVVKRQEINQSAAGPAGEPQDATPKPKPKGRPPAPGGRRRKK